MVYHPEKGELVVGVNLKDLTGNLRKEKEAGNKAALSIAFKSGYRAEPYLKPQIAVYDAATEKAALQARNRELEGHIVSQGDLLAKLVARLEAIEGAK